MWTVAAGSAAIALFLVTLYAFGVIRVAQDALVRARSAVAVMGDGSLSEEDKEAAVQRAAIGLLGSTLSIVLRSVACLLASAAPIYGLAALGLTQSEAVFAFLSRWDVILVSSVFIAAGMYCWMSWKGRRRRREAR